MVPKPGQQVDDKALKAFLKERLSPFKVPKAFYVVDELPKNAAGKILKPELKETAWQE